MHVFRKVYNTTTVSKPFNIEQHIVWKFVVLDPTTSTQPPRETKGSRFVLWVSSQM